MCRSSTPREKTGRCTSWSTFRAIIIDSHDSVGNIQDQVEDALAFIQRNIRCAIVVSGKAEHDRYWEYPVEGLREALANAVCHRDYGQPNNIQVKVFEDRVVSTNLGQLPFDMSLEELEDPDHTSRPRNKLIAQAFYDMHIIEHYGSGIRRIKDDCDKNGSPYPLLKNGNMEFRITFHAWTKESIAKLGIDPAKLGFAFGTEKSTENSGEDTEKSTENRRENTGKDPDKTGKTERLTETEARIVSILGKQNNATQGYIATQLGVTRTYVTKIMGNLQTQGVIRRVGPDKGGHWEVIEP